MTSHAKLKAALEKYHYETPAAVRDAAHAVLTEARDLSDEELCELAWQAIPDEGGNHRIQDELNCMRDGYVQGYRDGLNANVKVNLPTVESNLKVNAKLKGDES